RSQLDAIERGNVDAFYAPFYYERLFRRYAEALSFSPEAIDEMVQRFSPDAPHDPSNSDLSTNDSWGQEANGQSTGVDEESARRSADESSSAPWEGSGPSDAEGLKEGGAQMRESGEASSRSGADNTRSNSAALNRLTSAAGEQSAKGDQSSNWGIIAAFGLLAAGVVVALLVANSDDDRVPAKAPEAAAPAAAPADNANPQAESSGSQPATTTNGTPPTPSKSAPPAVPASPNQTAPAAPPKAAAPSAAPAPTPSGPASLASSPAAPSPASNNNSSPAAPTAAPASSPAPAKSSTPGPSSSAPAMEVTPKARTWIWVREADEKVREFGVAAGEKVVFQDMPIYFVIARPGESDIRIQGKAVKLPRTDQERDIGRYGRSQLIEAKPASAN
ncbi:MAG: hypothetical protein RLY67_260, partial [Pseudomonadota bacterium]